MSNITTQSGVQASDAALVPWVRCSTIGSQQLLPNMVDSAQHHPGMNKSQGKTTDSQRSTVRVSTVRGTTPYNIYRQSTIKNFGYDPEKLEGRRMIRKSDGSEWLPKTLEKINQYIEANGNYTLPKSILNVIENKKKQGSTEAEAIWVTIMAIELELPENFGQLNRGQIRSEGVRCV
jgi:hypothetical protein